MLDDGGQGPSPAVRVVGLGGATYRSDGIAQGDRRRLTRPSLWALLTALAVIVSGVIVPRPAAASYEFDGRRGRDVVVGVPGDDAVVVVPGSVDGPRPRRAQRLSATDVGLRSGGYAMVVGSGDVNGDGHDDLVVAQGQDGAGVRVVPGSRNGLRSGQAYSVAGPDGSEGFGDSLLVADVDRDGFDDVIAGYWRDAQLTDTLVRGAGGMHRHVAVAWGSADGAGSEGAVEIASPTPGGGPPLLLGVGNVGGDRARELVVVDTGSPHPESPAHRDGKMLLCEFGDDRGVRCGDEITVPRAVRDVAVGDFVGGGRADVVLSQVFDGEGQLHVYRATPRGLAPAVAVTQSTPGVPGRDEPGDEFGFALAASDVDRDGKTDLAVGVPGKNDRAGSVALLYGHRAGLAWVRARMISQQTPGVGDRDEQLDRFGHAVALLDVDGNRAADLVVGAPGENQGEGAVAVIRATSAGRLAPRAATSMLRPSHVGVAGNSSDPHSASMGLHLGR